MLYDRIVDLVLLIRRLSISANHLLNEAAAQQREMVKQLDFFTDYKAKAGHQEENVAAHARSARFRKLCWI